MQLILFPFRNSVLQKAITIKNKLYKVMAFIHTNYVYKIFYFFSTQPLSERVYMMLSYRRLFIRFFSMLLF